MCDENLPAGHHLREWDALVLPPLVEDIHAVDEDDEIIVGALVVHLSLLVVTARHDVWFLFGGVLGEGSQGWVQCKV